MRYLVPVLVVSIMMNATKFFEAYVAFENGEYNIRLASFRRNTTYSAIMNWVRFLLLGILPLSVIIFLYVKVYKDILERKRTQFLRQNPRPRNSSIINVSALFCTFFLYTRSVRYLGELVYFYSFSFAFCLKSDIELSKAYDFKVIYLLALMSKQTCSLDRMCQLPIIFSVR